MQDSAMTSANGSEAPANALRTATQRLASGSLHPSEAANVLSIALEYASATFQDASTFEQLRPLTQDLITHAGVLHQTRNDAFRSSQAQVSLLASRRVSFELTRVC